MSARIETITDRRITLGYAAFDVLYSCGCGEDAVKPAGLEGLSPGATYKERVEASEPQVHLIASTRGTFVDTLHSL